jgi:AcrR family transcriptional regulator
VKTTKSPPRTVKSRRKTSRARAADAPKLPLRERKKAATRATLIATARKLFAKKGYEAVTLEEICDAVPMHRTTFFAYFPSKEDLAFASQLDALAAFRTLLRERPKGADVEALWWTFRDHFGQQERGEESEVLQRMDHVPALRNRQAAIVRDYVEAIAEALAEEAGGGQVDRLYAELYASVMMAAHLAAARWFAGEFGERVESLDTAVFAKLVMSMFPTRADVARAFDRLTAGVDLTAPATPSAASQAARAKKPRSSRGSK